MTDNLSRIPAVYDDAQKLLSDLALTNTGSRMRDPADVVAPDGNTYTFFGDCEGCKRQRGRIEYLENAVSEMQELLAATTVVLLEHGIIKEGVPE